MDSALTSFYQVSSIRPLVCQEAKLVELRINMEDMFGIAADLGHYDLI